MRKKKKNNFPLNEASLIEYIRKEFNKLPDAKN